MKGISILYEEEEIDCIVKVSQEGGRQKMMPCIF